MCYSFLGPSSVLILDLVNYFLLTFLFPSFCWGCLYIRYFEVQKKVYFQGFSCLFSWFKSFCRRPSPNNRSSELSFLLGRKWNRETKVREIVMKPQRGKLNTLHFLTKSWWWTITELSLVCSVWRTKREKLEINEEQTSSVNAKLKLLKLTAFLSLLGTYPFSKATRVSIFIHLALLKTYLQV
jgi:hypothetical protein